MAYRLRPEEPVASGLRRLATKQLRDARDELRRATPPGETAIHEARKSLKKVRAILQLIEADHGTGLADGEKRLRKVNRTLSGLRDADAMLRILTKLRSRNPRLFDEYTFARIRRRLASHKRAAMEAAERAGAWKKLDRQLRTLRQAAKRWRPAHRGPGVLTRGIRFVHRRGRKAMARARNRERAADFHEWRKQIKTLWYELRLIERADRRIRRDVSALDRAETWLGDDHNVVVLCTELSKDASICRAVDLDRLRLAADRYQCDLREKAMARARRIYGRKSGAYVRGIKRALKTWHRARPTQKARRAAA